MNNNEIVLKTGRNEFVVVNKNDIKYIKASNNYSSICLKSEEKNITICQSLTKLKKENNLEDFITIRKGLIVNLKSISKLKTGKEPLIILKDGQTFKPSRRNINIIKTKIRKPSENYRLPNINNHLPSESNR